MTPGDPPPSAPPGRPSKIYRGFRRLFRHGRILGQFFSSGWNRSKYREGYAQLRCFCMFLGYARSGASLVGSLLDAHPDAVVAHELHTLRYLSYGFGRERLLYLLIRNAAEEHERGRTQSGYSYLVPNQWQGRFRSLHVIGDKRPGSSVRKYRKQPDLLPRFEKLIGVPVKYVHCMRNPFDNIATMFKYGSFRNLEEVILYFGSLVEAVEELRGRIPEENYVEVRHEDVVADAGGALRSLCEFLGLPADDDYLKDCASIVFASPRRTRDSVEWPSEAVKQVDELIARTPFFKGYSFDA